MHKKILELLACPICRTPLDFKGKESDDRLVNGYFKCSRGHVYQVKEEIGLLKDAELSINEFEWKVEVADEEKYDEIRKEYNSYLREDQKLANRRMTQKLAERVIKSCEDSENEVLDVASGMGNFILPLAERGTDLLIIGTDISEKPLRGAMSKAKKANTYDKISFVVTDGKHLAFRNAVFSTVSSNFGFDNIPEAHLALMESARVLKPGGRIIFSSLWLKEDSKSMQLAEEYKVGQIASENRLKKALQKARISLEWVEKMYTGVWPHNPMDLLPVEGEEYVHIVAQVRKPSG